MHPARSSRWAFRSRREPLSTVDAAWLRMDGPTNLMMITSVLVFDEPIDARAVAETIARLVKNRRFRQRVVPRGPRALGHAAWEDDPHFDVRAHVHRVALPQPGGDEELQAFISDRMSTPLDRSRPLWQVDVVEGVGAGTALVVRLHHCLGDGVALVNVLLGLADEGHEPAPVEVGLPPPAPPGSLRGRVAYDVDYVKTLFRLLFLPHDRAPTLRGPLGTQKRAAWSRAVPFERVHALAKARGAKANDVLMAAVAGALGGYLDARGVPLEDVELRGLVPVYLRGDVDDTGVAMGNHFGLVFVPLPVAIRDRDARIRAVKGQMDAIKGAPDAAVSFGVLAAMGLASPSLERVGIEIFTRKATLLITNVPGPRAPVHLAGKRVSRMMVWAPTSGRIGLGVSLLSYAGEVRLGVSGDERLVPDPEAIVAAFERELQGEASAASHVAPPANA